MSRAQEELTTQDLLQGYLELYHHGLSHVKPMAFGCAIQLGIPTAIHRHGGAATISDLATDTGVDPSKLQYLRRLMRVLTVSGIFAADHPPSSPSTGENETVYKLTPASRLLVGGEVLTTTSCDMSPMMRLLVRPTTSVSTFFSLEEWLKADGTASLFETAHGMSPWMMTKNDDVYNEMLNEACAADSNFAMDTVLKDAGVAKIFSGLGSLVDVGGGHGAAAVAIARAFPHIQFRLW
nr:unnamed protein product [Digitaria exilis]